MRIKIVTIGLAGFAALFLVGGAGAMQSDKTLLALSQQSDVVPVRLICDPSRCYDPQTGAYTKSNCNDRGCYPSSPVIGYLRPDQMGQGYGGSGRFYCDPSRCVDRVTGELWTSSCNINGCVPSRPAR